MRHGVGETRVGRQLLTAVSWTWRIKVLMHLETELMGTVRERAEDEAINVFARNLHDLLMAAPAGLRATMGLDPGLRTGVKVAVVDGTGKLVATASGWWISWRILILTSHRAWPITWASP
jgi:transcriptional accessory protein Tex/SPT6